MLLKVMKIKVTIQNRKKSRSFVYSTIHTLGLYYRNPLSIQKNDTSEFQNRSTTKQQVL